jgi:Bacterial regulatory proteins, luxR family/PAS fold
VISYTVSRWQLSAIWNAFPLPSLLLRRDLTIFGANDRFLEVTMTRPEEIDGRHLFDVFPDNPADGGSKSRSDLQNSLDRVIAQRAPDTMPITRYDIRDPVGRFVERHWTPSNHPVLDPRRGDLLYILHTLTDETERVLGARGLGEAARIQNAAEELRPVSNGESTNAELRLVTPSAAANLLSIAIEENFGGLTFREKEVLKLAIEGQANKAIAYALGISPRTVEVYRTNILKKTLKANFLELSRALHEFSRFEKSE